MGSLLDSAANQLKVAKRLAPRRGGSLRERVGKLDDRLVFVIGSPRSGTTFLAGAIGSLPGFVDLGEVAPVKAPSPSWRPSSPRRPLGVSARSSPSPAASGWWAPCARWNRRRSSHTSRRSSRSPTRWRP